MKNLKIKKQSKISDFLTSRGFGLTLLASLILFGAAIWVVMNKSINNIVDKNLNLLKKTNFSSNKFGSNKNDDLKTVNNIVHNLPIAKKLPTQNDNSKSDKKTSTELTSENSKEVPKQASENTTELENQDILFVPPVVGEIVNGFSGGELVKSKTLLDWRVHNAIDIAASQGTPVKSVADGEVLRVYSNHMLGTCVEIEHAQNINSVYCGLNKNLNVKEGDIVEAGDIIGSVGDTAKGESELGPHLHLEIKEKGEKINPTSKIKLS